MPEAARKDLAAEAIRKSRKARTTPVCTSVVREYEYEFTGDALFDRSTSGGRSLVRELCDGTVEVLVTESHGGGSVFGVGFEVPVLRRGVSVDFGHSRVDSRETGLLYVLSDRAEIEAFNDMKARPLIDSYKKGGAPLSAASQQSHDSSALKLADHTYTRVGSHVEVTLGAGYKGAYAGLEVGSGSAKIVETDLRTGQTTVSWELESTRAVELGYVILGEATGGLSASTRLSMATDRDGNPLRLEVSAAGQVQGHASGLNGQLDKLTDFAQIPSGLAVAAGLAERKEAARTRQVTVAIDLSDPDASEAAVRFVERPSLASGNALLRRVDGSASVLVEDYKGTVTTDSTEFGVAMGAALGVGQSDELTALRLVDDRSWDSATGGRSQKVARPASSGARCRLVTSACSDAPTPSRL